MPVTISLVNELDQRLEYQARALHRTFDDWASEILRHGFVLDVNSPRWRSLTADFGFPPVCSRGYAYFQAYKPWLWDEFS
jgi:hypothetical protein